MLDILIRACGCGKSGLGMRVRNEDAGEVYRVGTIALAALIVVLVLEAI